MFTSDFKRMFMRGLAVLLPTVVTIALFVWAFSWLNGYVAAPINRAIMNVLPYPDDVVGFFNYFRVDPARDALKYGTEIDELDPNTGERLTLEYKLLADQRLGQIVRGQAGSQDQQKLVKRFWGLAIWRITFRKYWFLSIIGFLIAMMLVYVVGYLISGLLGKTTWRIVEHSLKRIPMIRSIYPNVKQVTDFLLGDRKIEFAGVVAVEYPRKGVWSLGLVTGPALRTIQESTAVSDMITIFIPSSPTPMTGYAITTSRSHTIELALSIDEALRFTISGGVIKPPREGGQPEMAMQDVFPRLGSHDSQGQE